MLIPLEKEEKEEKEPKYLFPPIIKPKMTLRLNNHKYGSPSEYYGINYIFKGIPFNDYLRNIYGLCRSTVDPTYAINQISDLIESEKQTAVEYYTFYSANTRVALFLQYVSTVLRFILVQKNITTLLLKYPTDVWITENGKKINTIKKFYDYLGGTIDRTGDAVDGGHYPLDHTPLYRALGTSVNLNIFGGGNPKNGEHTLQYFLCGNSQTKTTGIYTLIENMILSFGFVGEMAKTIQAELTNFYKEVCNKNDSGNETKGTLLQILVKKTIVDKVVRITTPWGYPLPINTSVIMDLLQRNELNEIETKLKTIYDDNVTTHMILPETTRSKMKSYYLNKDDISYLQGRFISADENIIMTEGNVIINEISSDCRDSTQLLPKLYTLIITQILRCFKNPNNCMDIPKYKKTNPDACTIL